MNVKKVLETFQSDKSPGEDGFTAEFYKLFLDLPGNDLIASLDDAHAINELIVSQQGGVITLIPKEDGSLLELGNWRPGIHQSAKYTWNITIVRLSQGL